jgi:hypothetical protein
MRGDQKRGQINFVTNQGNLSFSRLETSAHCNLCGFNAISNYVKFLPKSKRLECYRKLLELTWTKHSDYANPFTTLTPELKLKLLFLEEFFKKREESASSYLDHTSRDNNKAKKSNALSRNHQIDLGNFQKAKLKFSTEQQIQNLNYDNFFKEFYLTGGVYRWLSDNEHYIYFDTIFNSGYLEFTDDSKIFTHEDTYLRTSYQNWLSFLMAMSYYPKAYLSIQDSKLIFEILLPNNSYIILGGEDAVDEDTTYILPEKFYTIKNLYYESIYRYCDEQEEVHYRELESYPIINKEDYHFNHQTKITDEIYKRLLNFSFYKILHSFESAADALEGVVDVSLRPLIPQSNISKFKHFLTKQSYDFFIKKIQDGEENLGDLVFKGLFNLEPYRNAYGEPKLDTNGVLDIIKNFDHLDHPINQSRVEEFRLLNQKYREVQKISQIALDFFKQENSFEQQFYHAINSNPLIVSNKMAHYNSYISAENIASPFPKEESIQSLYLDSLNADEIKKNFEKTFQKFLEREVAKFRNRNQQEALSPSTLEFPRASQSLPQLSREIVEIQFPSSSPSINHSNRNSSLFNKIAGRKDDNLRYRVSASESDNEPIHERMSRAIDQSKLLISADGVTDAVTQEITDDEILLAMLLAKNFGGINTKNDQIFSTGNHLDRERQALVNLIIIANSDGSKEVNQDLFNRLVNFSANFQIQCKKLGIYSGNKAIDERIFLNEQSIETRHGLRLAFIPDEFVLKYLNKSNIRKDLKDVANKLIAKKIDQTRSRDFGLVGRC